MKAPTSVTDLAIQGNSFFALGKPERQLPLWLLRMLAYLTQGRRLSGWTARLHLVNPDGYQVLDTDGNPIQFLTIPAQLLRQRRDFSKDNQD